MCVQRLLEASVKESEREDPHIWRFRRVPPPAFRYLTAAIDKQQQQREQQQQLEQTISIKPLSTTQQQ